MVPSKKTSLWYSLHRLHTSQINVSRASLSRHYVSYLVIYVALITLPVKGCCFFQSKYHATHASSILEKLWTLSKTRNEKKKWPKSKQSQYLPSRSNQRVYSTRINNGDYRLRKFNCHPNNARAFVFTLASLVARIFGSRGEKNYTSLGRIPHVDTSRIYDLTICLATDDSVNTRSLLSFLTLNYAAYAFRRGEMTRFFVW